MIYKTHLRAIAFGAVLLWGAQSAQGQTAATRTEPCSIPNIALLQYIKFYVNEESFRVLELEKPMVNLPLELWDIGSGPSTFGTWQPVFDSIIAEQPNCATGRALRFIKEAAELINLYEHRALDANTEQSNGRMAELKLQLRQLIPQRTE